MRGQWAILAASAALAADALERARHRAVDALRFAVQPRADGVTTVEASAATFATWLAAHGGRWHNVQLAPLPPRAAGPSAPAIPMDVVLVTSAAVAQGEAVVEVPWSAVLRADHPSVEPAVAAAADALGGLDALDRLLVRAAHPRVPRRDVADGSTSHTCR